MALALVLAASSAARAGFLSNGGMELPGSDGSTVITNWVESGDGNAVQQAPLAFEDSFFADSRFNSTFQGSQVFTLSQSFTVGSAGLYDLEFAYQLKEVTSGNEDMFSRARLFVQIDGLDVGLGDLVDYWQAHSFGNINSVYSSTRWQPITHAVNVSAGNHVLAFVFERDSTQFGRGYQYGLDAVEVVPEPSAFALLGVGSLCYVGCLLRQRKPHNRRSARYSC
jgi:hypothetical protein